MKAQTGQLVKLTFEGKEFEVIVIDPNGLGRNQASIGFGFGMMERHGGLPKQTASDWITEESAIEGVRNNGAKWLKTPSGQLYRVSEITDSENNSQIVLEVSDWVALAADVLKKPGKVRKSTLNSLIDFLSWFAVKGFYADAYAVLKGAYTEADSRSVSAWMEARLLGTNKRNRYTQFLQKQGCREWYHYANWTDYIYQGLFGMKAKKMIEVWDLVKGDKSIGRNHVPEAIGLEAIAYCETQVIELFYGDLKQAHDDAIGFARRKYQLNFCLEEALV